MTLQICSSALKFLFMQCLLVLVILLDVLCDSIYPQALNDAVALRSPSPIAPITGQARLPNSLDNKNSRLRLEAKTPTLVSGLYGKGTNLMGDRISQAANGVIIPNEFQLFQNCPNTLSNQIRIGVRLARDSKIKLVIHNIKGKMKLEPNRSILFNEVVVS